MIAEIVSRVRGRAPLVHCLSATVSMGIVADGLLSAGARPMMTETAEEAPTLVGLADALLVNLGTLSTDGLAGIPPTVEACQVPWVLDPAAVGPTRVRRDLAFSLLHRGPSVVRANASEVLVLAGGGPGGRGPDATDATDAAVEAALSLAADTGSVVAVSGATDQLVSPAGDRVALANGSPLLPLVVGTGCLLGALTAACCAVAEPWEAAISATSWLNVAAERAASEARGPASFRLRLIDELHCIQPEHVEEGTRFIWI